MVLSNHTQLPLLCFSAAPATVPGVLFRRGGNNGPRIHRMSDLTVSGEILAEWSRRLHSPGVERVRDVAGGGDRRRLCRSAHRRRVRPAVRAARPGTGPWPADGAAV